MNEIGFYCLSYKNKKREQIEKVLNALNIKANIHSGVEVTNDKLEQNTKRCWSICYGHLDMINTFYNSEYKYGIFCEDDIIIRNDFMKHLPSIIENFNDLKLDILLLGYLCENPIDTYCNFPLIKESPPFKYLGYPEELWGTQLYLISKSHAFNVLNKYNSDYANKTIDDKSLKPFAADWTITKEGNRALIYPLIAIENKNDDPREYAYQRCHISCYNFSYDKNLFDNNSPPL